MTLPRPLDRDATIAALYRAGQLVRDIAETCETSIATVSRTLGKLGLRLSPSELSAKRVAASLTPEAMAKRVAALKRPLADRFAKKVIIGAASDDCWGWTGSVDGHGYPQIRDGETLVLGSHVSLTLDGKPRPEGLCALHTCDNPICTNPRHLWWGTRKENSQDALQKGRLDLSGLSLGRGAR